MITSIQYLAATLMGFFAKDSIKSQKGVTMIEYGLIAGLVAIVIITALQTTGTNLDSIFDTIATELGNAAGAGAEGGEG